VISRGQKMPSRKDGRDGHGGGEMNTGQSTVNERELRKKKAEGTITLEGGKT